MSAELPATSPPPVTPIAAPRPTLAVAVYRQLRVKQWTKNGAVLAPLLFAKAVLVPAAVKQSLLALAAFCLVASGIYVLNDWLDREKDRLHPEKKKRPIAAGHLSGTTATALALVLWAGAAAVSWYVRPAFAGVVAGYVALQFLYSFLLKRLVILDVMAIAMGFVLRVIGGGVAIDVPVSNWLFLCTLLLAVFLGFAKRRHELSSLQADAAAHRANLEEYSLPMLDQMMSMVAAACILAYGLYTVSPQTTEHVGSDRLKYTVPFVIYGVFRYLFLVHKRGMGGSPEKVLLSDPPFIIDILLYLAVMAWGLYG